MVEELRNGHVSGTIATSIADDKVHVGKFVEHLIHVGHRDFGFVGEEFGFDPLGPILQPTGPVGEGPEALVAQPMVRR